MNRCKTCGHYSDFNKHDWKDKEVVEAKFQQLKDERFIDVWITAKSSHATSTTNIVMPIEGMAVLEKSFQEFKKKMEVRQIE